MRLSGGASRDTPIIPRSRERWAFQANPRIAVEHRLIGRFTVAAVCATP